MPKIDLGEKQTCLNCGTKFYDLNKRPAKCPKCGNTFDPQDEEVLANLVKARMTGHDLDDNTSDEEEDEDAIVKVVKNDVDEDEIDSEEEVTKEIDIEAIDEPELIMGDDGDDDGDIPINPSEPLPEGFSEQELDEDELTVADDDALLVEDDDELFEEELAELDINEDDEDLS